MRALTESAITERQPEFSGTVNWVQLDLGADDFDHYISPQERMRIAIAKQ